VNFDLTEDQRILEETASRFAAEEIVPRRAEEVFRPELVRRMGEVGAFRVRLSGLHGRIGSRVPGSLRGLRAGFPG